MEEFKHIEEINWGSDYIELVPKGMLHCAIAEKFGIKVIIKPNSGVTQPYHAKHNGVDIAAPIGSKITIQNLPANAKIFISGYNKLEGNFVIIYTGIAREYNQKPFSYLYISFCHLLAAPKPPFKPYPWVFLSGNTGKSTGPHVHVGCGWYVPSEGRFYSSDPFCLLAGV